MPGIRLQDWPCIETALGKCNFIMKYSIYRIIGRPNQDKLPAFQPYSIQAMNGYQLTCNAFIRYSNNITITPPPITFKHGANVLVCVIMVGLHPENALAPATAT